MAKYEGVRERVKGKRYEIYFRPYKGAEQIYRNIEAVSFSEAYYKRQALIAEYSKKLNVSAEDRLRLTANFADAWQALERDITADSLAKKTVARYKNTYWRVFGEFREKHYPSIQNLTQVNLPFFREYKNYFAIELKYKGADMEMGVVKAMIKRLKSLGYCDDGLIDELKEIKKGKQRKKEYPNISDSQFKKLFDHIRQDRPDYYRPLYFMFRTGRRREETTLIEKKDVITNGLEPLSINIRAETTKTGDKAPLRCLDDDLKGLIRAALSNNKTSWLFPNRLGRKCTSNKLYEYLKKTSREVIGTEITPHYFRHRFCTKAGQSNLPIPDVKAITGIRDNDTLLNYYSHSTTEGQLSVLQLTRL